LWLWRGIIAQRLKNFNSAVESFSKVIDLNPDFEYGWLCRAQASLEMFDFINSIEENVYLQVDNQGSNSPYKSEVVQDYSQILADYNKALDLNPDLAVAYYNRANLKVKAQNYDGALYDYDRALKLDPEFADAYYNMALVLIYRQNSDKACQALSKAGELGLQKSYLVIKRYCTK
jgi:tetratricopeptide (TPR) repeat protein